MSRAYPGEIACPHCGGSDSKVTNTEGCKLGDKISRRRECLRCRKRFTTTERVTHDAAALAAADRVMSEARTLRDILRGRA